MPDDGCGSVKGAQAQASRRLLDMPGSLEGLDARPCGDRRGFDVGLVGETNACEQITEGDTDACLKSGVGGVTIGDSQAGPRAGLRPELPGRHKPRSIDQNIETPVVQRAPAWIGLGGTVHPHAAVLDIEVPHTNVPDLAAVAAGQGESGSGTVAAGAGDE
ncbi:hypothetical protein [Streptomyces rapamycinicus]|uniref:hypothetical protein n=1 Tax=Streptomyces rapamycinicus TaxID=1226757 RepID=UPI001AD831F3|nr:hypothetical protein [Streptomyces rapamycinicus]